MFTYRMWHPDDAAWLVQAAAASAWEALAPEERAFAQPGEVVLRTQHRMLGMLASGWGTAIIAQWEQRPVGFILLGVIPDGTTEEFQGFLFDIWVVPAHRKRGAARQLQSLAEMLFARLGLRKVKLWTDLHNRPVLELAQRLGYTPEGVIGMKTL